MKPVVVKIPVPIMLATTTAVAAARDRRGVVGGEVTHRFYPRRALRARPAASVRTPQGSRTW